MYLDSEVGCGRQLYVYYQNVRSIKNKSLDVIAAICSSDYDVVAFTETWLTPDCYSGEFFDLNRYAVFRTDRLCKRGGKVLLAVRTDFPSHQLNLAELQANSLYVDLVGVAMIVSGLVLRVLLLYIPPCYPVESLVTLLDSNTDVNTMGWPNNCNW